MATRSTHAGGANFAMGDGSVRFLRDGAPADSFCFTPAPGQTGLLLPAVQSAREAARAGDGSVMPDDAQGIIAILIGLADPRADDERAGDGSVMPDDVVVDGLIVTAGDWG